MKALSILAEFRFPKPEFTQGYETPSLVLPGSAAPWFEYLSLGLFIALLVLSALAMFRWRSRKLLFVLMLFSVVFFGFIRQGCVCAIGAIGNVSAAAGSPEYPLSIFTLLIFLLPLLLALFLGRVFCGATCPFGALQDLLLIKNRPVPPALDAALRTIPPLFLGLAVVFAYCDMGFLICQYDPFVGLFRLDLKAGSIVFTLGFLALSTMIGRPYCRYLCPYGFLLKMASYFSQKRISITAEDNKCINCELCDTACPVNAIERPRLKKHKQSIHHIAKRVQILLALLPLFIAGGVMLGNAVTDRVSVLNHEVALLQKIEQKQMEDDAVISYMSNMRPLSELQTQVDDIKQRVHISMMVLGAWFGFIINLSLIMTYRRRYNENYEIDAGNCINCLRCYDYCPINQQQKNNA